jgi:hypothetical protein
MLRLEWEYEKEGYDLGKAGWYLPDFWFPEQELCHSMFVEIKPKLSSPDDWPTDKQGIKELTALEELTGETCVMLCGNPGPNLDYNGFIPCDCDYLWCQCPECRTYGVQYEGRSARNKHRPGCTVPASQNDKNRCTDSLELLLAYEHARRARYDGGELKPGMILASELERFERRLG